MSDLKQPERKTNRVQLSSSYPTVPTKFNLQYIKLRCLDIKATIDFYSNIGMVLLNRSEIQQKDGIQTLFSLHFPTHPATTLLFTHISDTAYDISAKTIQHPEYLLIYMFKLDRISSLLKSRFKCLLPATDLSDTKLALFVDPNGLVVRLQELSEMSSRNAMSKSTKSVKWSGRLGYFAMPSKDANNSLTYYSNLFSYTKTEYEHMAKSKDESTRKKNAAKARKNVERHTIESSTLQDLKVAGAEELKNVNALDDSIMQRLKLTSLKKTDIDYTSTQIDAELDGFKLVDIEDFMIGLCRYLHLWMANGPRSQSFSICFTEKIEAGDSILASALDFDTVRRQSNLISLGYQVEHLDNAVDRMLSKGQNLKLDVDREYIHNFGIFQRFYDEMNMLEIDIFCRKEDYESGARRGDKLLDIIKKDDRREEKERKGIGAPAVVVKAESLYEIDFAHLRGQSRNLSVGAIHSKKVFKSVESLDKGKIRKGKKEEVVKETKLPAIPKFGSSHF